MRKSKIIRNNKSSAKVLSAALFAGCAIVGLGQNVNAQEIYPGVDIPDEVYKTEYGDNEKYSEIKYYNGIQIQTEQKFLLREPVQIMI